MQGFRETYSRVGQVTADGHALLAHAVLSKEVDGELDLSLLKVPVRAVGRFRNRNVPRVPEYGLRLDRRVNKVVASGHNFGYTDPAFRAVDELLKVSRVAFRANRGPVPQQFNVAREYLLKERGPVQVSSYQPAVLAFNVMPVDLAYAALDATLAITHAQPVSPEYYIRFVGVNGRPIR